MCPQGFGTHTSRGWKGKNETSSALFKTRNLHGTPDAARAGQAGQPGVVSSPWDQEDTNLEESWIEVSCA